MAKRGEALVLDHETEKDRVIGTAIEKLDKKFGKGTLMRVGTESKLTVSSIPTGILPLDVALGVGGLPRGRVIEIFGPESSGKTTVTLQVIAETQQKGGICAFVDAEHALDPSYAARIGVNLTDLLVAQPSSGEEALEIVMTLVDTKAVDLVVVDSVAALTPKAEIDGEIGEMQVGAQARLMSHALRKLTMAMGESKTTVIFINQLREKIQTGWNPAGAPIEVTSGGRALKFYSSVRIDVRRIETLKRDGREYGNKVRAKVVKNKVAPPFRAGTFEIIFGEGTPKEGMLLDMGVELGLVSKQSSWYQYGEEKIGHGREGAIIHLKAFPEVLDELEQRIRAKLDFQEEVAALEEEDQEPLAV